MRSALAELAVWLRPASMEALVIELSERYLASGRQAETGDDRKALIALYARKLRDYPADVALDAVRGWRGKFFPAFEELRDIILADRRLHVRRQKQSALRAYFDGSDEPQGDPVTRAQIERNARWAASAKGQAPAPLTQEKRDRLAEVDRVHGDAAKARPRQKTEAV